VSQPKSRLQPLVRVMGTGWVYWPMCVVGMGLVALAVLGPEADRRIRIEHHCQVMEAEVESLRRTQETLLATAEALESDPAYTERVVRQDLRLVRPGERPMPAPPTLRVPQDEQAVLRWKVPPLIALVAPWSEPRWRLAALVAGAALLAAAIIFSLPDPARSSRSSS